MENFQRFEQQPPVSLPGWSHPFWRSESSRSSDWSRSPAFQDRILLAAGLWAMLALVALAVIVSRYLLPVLLVVSIVLFATLRIVGLV
jgi:hypothetical protein